MIGVRYKGGEAKTVPLTCSGFGCSPPAVQGRGRSRGPAVAEQVRGLDSPNLWRQSGEAKLTARVGRRKRDKDSYRPSTPARSTIPHAWSSGFNPFDGHPPATLWPQMTGRSPVLLTPCSVKPLVLNSSHALRTILAKTSRCQRGLLRGGGDGRGRGVVGSEDRHHIGVNMCQVADDVVFGGS